MIGVGLDLSAVIVAIIAAMSGVFIAVLNRRTLGRVETKTDAAAQNLATNHGKTAGAILESAAADASLARRYAEAASTDAAQAKGSAGEHLRLLEVIDGRLHNVSKRVDAQGREISDVRHHMQTIEGQQIAMSGALDDVGKDLRTHLDEVAPLTSEFVAVTTELRATGALRPKEEDP